MKRISKNEGIFLSQEENGTLKFLQEWTDFEAKTGFGIVLEYFCRIEVELKITLSEEKRE